VRYFIALILILFLLLCGAVSSSSKDLVDVSHTFRISAFGGAAHGCAVNGVTLTNRHVVDKRNSILEPLALFKFRYDFFENANRSGVGQSLLVSPFSDLATVQLDQVPPFGYAKLGAEPKIGDRIRWVEFDFRKAENAYKPRGRSGKVIAIFAGQIVLKTEAIEGASGGCAYNDANEVVGLMSYKRQAEDDEWVTVVVGFYGGWWAR